jgi:hypothetical protein
MSTTRHPARQNASVSGGRTSSGDVASKIDARTFVVGLTVMMVMLSLARGMESAGGDRGWRSPTTASLFLPLRCFLA